MKYATIARMRIAIMGKNIFNESVMEDDDYVEALTVVEVQIPSERLNPLKQEIHVDPSDEHKEHPVSLSEHEGQLLESE
mgnify:CR=1 FL=1